MLRQLLCPRECPACRREAGAESGAVHLLPCPRPLRVHLLRCKEELDSEGKEVSDKLAVARENVRSILMSQGEVRKPSHLSPVAVGQM